LAKVSDIATWAFRCTANKIDKAVARTKTTFFIIDRKKKAA
jgi:hypothetical protein